MSAVYNLELECGLIGSCLYYPGIYPQMAGKVRRQHFHEAFLGDVFEWIGGQHEDGARGGEVLQLAALHAVAHKDKGKETIAHCIASTIVPVDVPYAVTALVQLYDKRLLLKETLGKNALDLVAVKDDDRQTEFGPGQAWATEVQGRRAYAGLEHLDRKIDGWQAGRFYVIGGRPGSGKSTVALSLCLQSAKRGHGVGFFSLEMSAAELDARALSDLAYTSTQVIPYRDIAARNLTDYQHAEIEEQAKLYRGLPIIINDKAAPSLFEIREGIQAMKDKHRIDVVVVDHLGLVKPTTSYKGNKVAETGEVSSGLKALAKDLDVAVIAICQLNREVEGRENKKPTLADLRWAGEIEQDADVVMMIYRPAYYLDESMPEYHEQKHQLQILIRKNRSGETGKVECFCEMAAAHVRERRD